jgi:hypothetical protein
MHFEPVTPTLYLWRIRLEIGPGAPTVLSEDDDEPSVSEIWNSE